jgi:hypothetical protein
MYEYAERHGCSCRGLRLLRLLAVTLELQLRRCRTFGVHSSQKCLTAPLCNLAFLRDGNRDGSAAAAE